MEGEVTGEFLGWRAFSVVWISDVMREAFMSRKVLEGHCQRLNGGVGDLTGPCFRSGKVTMLMEVSLQQT